jgi:hypothetical protein
MHDRFSTQGLLPPCYSELFVALLFEDVARC